MVLASWYRMIDAMSATAGKMPLKPAREAGHEVRLDEAQHDAPVGEDVVAVHEHGLPVGRECPPAAGWPDRARCG